MKKFFLAFLFIPFLLAGCGGSSSGGDTPIAHNINVLVDEVTITEGKEFQIPIEIIKKTIIVYHSNNEEIATISREGVITALKEGETSISITGGKNDHYLVFVTVLAETTKDALQIVMPKTQFTLELNDEFVLPLSVKLGNDEIKNATITYEYENEGIISITSLTVNALSVGTTKVVANATYSELEVSEIFTVTVY